MEQAETLENVDEAEKVRKVLEGKEGRKIECKEDRDSEKVEKEKGQGEGRNALRMKPVHAVPALSQSSWQYLTSVLCVHR